MQRSSPPGEALLLILAPSPTAGARQLFSSAQSVAEASFDARADSGDPPSTRTNRCTSYAPAENDASDTRWVTAGGGDKGWVGGGHRRFFNGAWWHEWIFNLCPRSVYWFNLGYVLSDATIQCVYVQRNRLPSTKLMYIHILVYIAYQ